MEEGNQENEDEEILKLTGKFFEVNEIISNPSFHRKFFVLHRLMNVLPCLR